MTDIARHLNISQATVSYVLSGRASGSISEVTRARVLEAAEQLGYRRNRAAQALSGHRSYLIELCVYGLHTAFYAHVLDAFDRQLRPTRYELHIVNLASSSKEDWMANGIWPVDGVIADVALSEQTLASLMQRDTPIVSTGPKPNRNIDHVFVDLRPALSEAMRHLTERGRRIAHVSRYPIAPNDSGGSATPNRVEGAPVRYDVYQQAIQEARLIEEVILPLYPKDSSRQGMRESVRTYIQQNGCPDGFLCFNDEIAIATLAALRDLGRRVPEDAMIIGCDGIEETAFHHPAISTIQYPFDNLAQLAWEFLQRRIANPDLLLQSATLTAELVLRNSSAR